MDERQRILNKTGGRCYYCGRDLPDLWHVDHKFPKNKAHWIGTPMMEETCAPNDLEDVEAFRNKVPACISCNIRKGALDVEQFRSEIAAQVQRLNDYSNQYDLAKRFGLIEETDKEVLFYFETMQAQAQNE